VIDVVCLGPIVADTIARPVDSLPPAGTLALVEELTLHGGGGALNAASWLSAWALQVAVVGKVGTDVFGEFVLRLLEERGIASDGVVRSPGVATSATVVLVGSDGDRTFLHLPGANGALDVGDLDAASLYAGRALLYPAALALPALDGEPAAGVLAEAKRRGLFTAVDAAFDATGRWSRVVPALPHVDLFTPAFLEARAITGLEDPRAAAAWLRERGATEVAIKLGERGCYASGADFEGYVAGASVSAVDSTGAGDAFTAGVLYGKLAGWPFERAVRLGAAAGARATTALGAAAGMATLAETMALDAKLVG
jgi:sugar/nucleoside kinase (ribokinase family)